MNTIPPRKSHKLQYSSKLLSYIIIFIAIIFRLVDYLNNRSLFADEASIALDIIDRTFLGFLYPSESYQTAPFGFLATEKLITEVLGYSDYTFRVFPFLCGIIAPFLFYKVATHYLKQSTIPIALGLFAVSDRLIYYSSTVKPYSSDVTIALLLYITALYIQSRKLTIFRVVLFGMLGTIVIWFSYPAVFILAGLGICLVLFSFIEKDYSKIWKLSITYLSWGVSFAIFAIFYLLYYRDSPSSIFMQNWWAYAFMPLPPSSVSDVKWFINTFINMGIFSVIGEWWGMQPYSQFLTDIQYKQYKILLSGITGLLLYVGCISMFYEKKRKFFMLVSPILFTLLASGLHIYPFADRLILFLIPIMFIFIAEGVEQISDKVMRSSVINMVILLIVLYIYPLKSIVYHLEHTRSKSDDIRQVVDYIVKNQKDRDFVYFRGVAVPEVCRYYSEVYSLKNTGCFSMVTEPNAFLSDISLLREKSRVWVIFPARYIGNIESDALSYLDSIGTRIEKFVSKDGPVVYLYEMKVRKSVN